MGNTAKSSSKQQSKPKHRGHDHNGDARDVTPAGDEEIDNFKHLVDGDNAVPATPSVVSLPVEQMSPTFKRLHEEQAAKQSHHGTVSKTHSAAFLTRPDSNGSDVQPKSFNFAPPKPKTGNYGRLNSKRPTPPVAAQESRNKQVQAKQDPFPGSQDRPTT